MTAAAALLATALALTGCTAAHSVGSTPTPTRGGTSPVDRVTASETPTTVTPTTTPTVTPAPTQSLAPTAEAIVSRMSTAERAGQVLMTAATVGDLPSLASVVRRYHLAGVMVRGRSAAGTHAVHAAFAPVRAAAPVDLPLLTATDQEGGYVQVLSGPGFAVLPSAVQQATWSAARLQAQADDWGRSLAHAGVNLDLGPVADVPCAATRDDNPPIADLDRNYGDDPATAGRHVAAFVRGLRSVGVESTVKHFPGLGCVRENTDTTANVVDRVTTTTSPRLASFRSGIDAGAGFVMVSSATYTQIDPGSQALFSTRVIGGLLRGRLGFTGVVMSDDVGGAVALRSVPVGQRAVRFVAAGGDLMLDILPADVPTMSAALVARADADPAFASTLTAAALRVVAARLRAG